MRKSFVLPYEIIFRRLNRNGFCLFYFKKKTPFNGLLVIHIYLPASNWTEPNAMMVVDRKSVADKTADLIDIFGSAEMHYYRICRWMGNFEETNIKKYTQ